MIRQKQSPPENIIDLTGPDGNAFSLMARAVDLGKQLGYNAHDCSKIQEEMTRGDYENLIAVFDKYFGDYVILER